MQLNGIINNEPKTHPRKINSATGNKFNLSAAFVALLAGRERRKLGDHFELSNFGINQTTLVPGAISALFHHHSKQDEFIYILDGAAALLHGDNEYPMQPGDCMGFKAGSGIASQLVNRSAALLIFLEVGDRTAGDEVEYPNDDLAAEQQASGAWRFVHSDGRPY